MSTKDKITALILGLLLGIMIILLIGCSHKIKRGSAADPKRSYNYEILKKDK